MQLKPQRKGFTRRSVLGTGVAGAVSMAALPSWATPNHQRYIRQEVARVTGGKPALLRILLPEGSRANADPVIAEFVAQTGVNVAVREVAVDEVNLQLSLDTMAGVDDYDLAIPATFGIPDLVQDNAIRPITDFVNQHEDGNFRDSMLFRTGDSFDGEVYGFQTDGDAYVMFYLADWLDDPEEGKKYADQYGMPLTKAETWAEFDRQVAWFNRPDEGKFGGLLFRTSGYVAWEWWVRFHANGTWPLSSDLTPQVYSDSGMNALESLIRLTEHLAPDTAHAGLFENWKRYEQGDIFANIGWGGSQKYFNAPQSPIRGKLRYGATPGGIVDGVNLKTPYFNWGWNYVVTATSPEPELAYLFALFAASPEMSALSVRQADGFFDPHRTEHYSDQSIIEAYSEEFLAVHHHSMTNAIPDLYLARQGQYFLALSDWISRALVGQVTPEEALRRIEQEWNIISHEVGYVQQTERWRALRAKYPAQVRGLLRDLS